MDLQHIPLSQLKIATVNVRHSRKPPDVSDILPSIRARGVLQPLLVRPNGKGFEIVAGRRRYFAASLAAEEQGASRDEVLLPCAVTESGDDAGAVEASLIENVARAPMDELEEYEAFAKLLKQGRSVAGIARTFGVSELYVKQRLALASLHPKIKDAYRNGDIESEELQWLTAASKHRQKEWVSAFEAGNDPENEDAEGAPRGYQLKRWLFGATRSPRKTRAFRSITTRATSSLISSAMKAISLIVTHSGRCRTRPLRACGMNLRRRGGLSPCWNGVNALPNGATSRSPRKMAARPSLKSATAARSRCIRVISPATSGAIRTMAMPKLRRRILEPHMPSPNSPGRQKTIWRCIAMPSSAPNS
jgi:ParB/RepB/Spo0J family partition protein